MNHESPLLYHRTLFRRHGLRKFIPGKTLFKTLHQTIKMRDKQCPQNHIYCHTENDCCTQCNPTFRPCTRSEKQRHHTQHKCQLSQKKRTQTHPAGLDCSLIYGFSLRPILPGEFHNKNGIFGRKGNEQHNTYLTIHTDRKSH